MMPLLVAEAPGCVNVSQDGDTLVVEEETGDAAPHKQEKKTAAVKPAAEKKVAKPVKKPAAKKLAKKAKKA